jgi:cysteine desulfurase / selenocysteine lyase
MSIYLDNAATSYPKPPAVLREMARAFTEIGVAPGRGGHRRGIEASRLVFEARERIAELIAVADSSRIVFTHSATEALNLAVQGLLKPGDHVITTTMEHNSLIRPLAKMARKGVEVTKVAADRSGRIDLSVLQKALRKDTRLVALSHCSNVTGTIQPLDEIRELARRSGIPLLVDAAQSAGSIPLSADGISLLAAPGHKGLLGPQGTGFLYVAEGVELEPLLVGGTGGFSDSDAPPPALPERYESGTMNTPGIAGLKAGVEFILETGIAEIRRKEAALTAQLARGIAAIPGTTIHGPGPHEERGAVVSFTVAGADPSELGHRLDAEFGITVRVGLHCAPDAHRTIGTWPHGTVRVSPGYFTTEEDAEAFMRSLRSLTA